MGSEAPPGTGAGALMEAETSMARTMSQGARAGVGGEVGGWALRMRPGVEVGWRVRETEGEGVRAGEADMASWGRMGIWTWGVSWVWFRDGEMLTILEI